MKQCSRLLQNAPKGGVRDELQSLRMRLDGKIKVGHGMVSVRL